MAIISSVLTGKAKGKIGNIVLATVKGQTTAREYNPNPTYSNSAGQTLQRGRLRNAVMAWQFLNIFLQYAKPLAKSTESIYNAFIRLVVNLLPEAVFESRAQAAETALGELIYAGNFVKVDAAEMAIGSSNVAFTTNYFPFVSGTKVILLDYNSSTGYRFVKVVPLTESAWTAGEIAITDAGILGAAQYAYIISADGSKMSNIKAGV